MKFNLEEYIINKIDKGDWKPNKAIESEKKLIEVSGLSKMSVRKILDKLKEREVLYSVQGNGVYVSPFINCLKVEKLEKLLGATKVTTLPSKTKIPLSLLGKFDEFSDMREEDTLTFVKLYFIKEEIVAFTLNWLNNSEKKYNIKDIINGNKSLHVEENFNKIISKHKLEETSSSDRNILLTSFEYVPTSYSYYIKKNRQVSMIRITKMKPKFYSALEVKNK